VGRGHGVRRHTGQRPAAFISSTEVIYPTESEVRPDNLERHGQRWEMTWRAPGKRRDEENLPERDARRGVLSTGQISTQAIAEEIINMAIGASLDLG